jgi:putative flippase GtrA
MFIFIGFDYRMAILIATIIGVVFNYFTISMFVFNVLRYDLIWKFILIYFMIYIFNISLIGILKDFGYNDYLSGFVSIVPSAGISFLLNKYFVYS